MVFGVGACSSDGPLSVSTPVGVKSLASPVGQASDPEITFKQVNRNDVDSHLKPSGYLIVDAHQPTVTIVDGAVRATTWIGNELVISSAVKSYEYTDGTASEVDLPRPIAGVEAPQRSLDRHWRWDYEQAVPGSSPFGSVTVTEISGTRAFRLTSLGMPEWSPTATAMAFIGNYCTTFDLMLFDPVKATLRNAFDGEPHADVSSLKWRPDGSAISIEATTAGKTDLELLDLASGSVVPWLSVTRGTLTPISWSQDGKELLVRSGGRHASCNDIEPGKTTLEVVH